jgi:hypothetical protein
MAQDYKAAVNPDSAPAVLQQAIIQVIWAMFPSRSTELPSKVTSLINVGILLQHLKSEPSHKVKSQTKHRTASKHLAMPQYCTVLILLI